VEEEMRPKKWEKAGEEDRIARDPEKPEWLWYVRVTNLVDACGEEEAAEMSGRKDFVETAEVQLVPVWKSLTDKQREDVIKGSIGEEEFKKWNHPSDEVMAEITAQHGISTMAGIEQYGSTPEGARRKALREAEWDIEKVLSRVVNKIGMTGREWIANDMTSCFERHKMDSLKPRTVANAGQIMPGMNGVERKIKQGDMTGECWNIQIWGEKRCETCEFRGKPDCGGQNIRRTGFNSKGIAVPIPDG
jgi:hypothetical protein